MTHDRDDVLDDLRAALDVEPSPEFHARVRMAVEAGAVRPFGRQWMFVGVSAAVAAVVLVNLWPRPSSTEHLRSATAVAVKTAAPSVGESTAAPPVTAAAATTNPRVQHARVAGPVAVRRPVEPEVLVPPGQLQLLLAYADARRASAEIEADHVAAPVIDVLVPEAIEVVAAPIVDVIKG